MGKGGGYGLLTRLAGAAVGSAKRSFKERNERHNERTGFGKALYGVKEVEYEKAPSKRERRARREYESIDPIEFI